MMAEGNSKNVLYSLIPLDDFKLLEKNNLSVEDIGHHNKVVGWKDCPLPWVKNPELFEVFKDEVKNKMGVLL
jgi:N-acetylmuramoyl-L-alanine amidase CwlA